MIEIIQPLGQFHANIGHGAFQILPTSYIVGGGENRHMVTLGQYLAREYVELYNAIHLIIEHFNAHGLFAIGRGNDLNDIPAHPEGAALEVDIVAVVLNLYQLVQNFLSIDNLT